MQTLSTALEELREKGAWFVRASQIRLLLIRTSVESWNEVLRIVANLQFHPENRSSWVFLSGTAAGTEGSRPARADRLEDKARDHVRSHDMVVVLTPAPDSAELESKIEALLEVPSFAGCRFVLVLDPALPLLPRLMRAVGDQALACDCRVEQDDSPSPEGHMAQVVRITSSDSRGALARSHERNHSDRAVCASRNRG